VEGEDALVGRVLVGEVLAQGIEVLDGRRLQRSEPEQPVGRQDRLDGLGPLDHGVRRGVDEAERQPRLGASGIWHWSSSSWAGRRPSWCPPRRTGKPVAAAAHGWWVPG
jgi:hypothetical protein